MEKDILIIAQPVLVAQWHPTKNGELLPSQVTVNSTTRVWWKCPEADDHEWEVRVTDRVKGPCCPFCINQRLSITNSLKTRHPALAIKWHPTKNGDLTPETVIGTGQHKKYWWKCPLDPSHEWEASIASHIRDDGTYRDCPLCKAIPLAITNPEIALQWHPTKNLSLTPNDVIAGSATFAWWKCPHGPDHEWETKIVERKKYGCPFCDGKKVSVTNSLETLPELAKEWHPTKNGNLKPSHVFGGGNKKYWWKCSKGDDHEWEASIGKRSTGQSCSVCRGLKVVLSNCLATTHPELIEQWHPTKNGILTPYDIIAGSGKSIWWLCKKHPEHEWETSCKNRTKSGSNSSRDCPFCTNHRVCKSNSLAATNPILAKEWHPTKNGHLMPYDITEGSGVLVWWQCSNNQEHDWQAKPVNRSWGTGCSLCNSGWTIDAIRRFVSSLLPHLETLSPAGMHVLLQQNGLLKMAKTTKGHSFVQALKTGCFPKEELEKFVAGQPSLVDEFVAYPKISLEEHEDDLQAPENTLSEKETLNLEGELLTVQTKDILATLDSKLFSSLDREAIDFFIKEAVARIWQHAFSNEPHAIQQLEQYCGDGNYPKEVRELFLKDYHGTKDFIVPSGYSSPYELSLMQRYTAHLVKSRKRLGNWSGTGAGKTLSAILASRVIEANLTIICCPNNVIDTWVKQIKETYPDSTILIKKNDLKEISSTSKYQYLILNYEFFQQPSAGAKLQALLNKCSIDFVIIDEIHFSKQREVEKISERKKMVAALLSWASTKNENLYVLGMSATPVINNLFEGKTLIELVTGFHHDDLQTKATVSNCISHYQKFVSHGIRWLPQYQYKMNPDPEEYIDCSSFLPEIKHHSAFGSMVDVEAVLTKAKLPFILKNLRSKTIVYTHYLKGIESVLQDAIAQAGWKVSLFTGETKDGLKQFIEGDADVLIASSCIGTGVDGLQYVSNRLIINSLPWTHAEFEQLKGRIYRPGQKSDHVDILVPLTFANVNGEKWSWCESRWKRIQFKKSISDAAVDGVIPEGLLRTPAQAYKDTMDWLERLERGEVYEVERRKIIIPLSEETTVAVRRQFGDLTQMNYRINHELSKVTHGRFLKNPTEWEHYHAVYREDRKNWPIIPYQEAIKWFKARPHMVIGDFGCGEALLATELENTVHSFDHVAINKKVTPCDMTHVPLDDACLDAAVFSLSLMGTNFIDYLKEAHRCLKLDGHLWIAEPTSRIKDIRAFKDFLFRLGFDVNRTEPKWKFTFIRALKSEREMNLAALETIRTKDIIH